MKSAQASRFVAGAHGMTAQQLRFVEEYLVDLNGSRAAVAAGYSAKTAGAKAESLLKLPHVATRIGRALEMRRLTAKITGDELLGILATAARFEPAKFFERGESRHKVPGWVMTEEQLRDLPPEIGCLVEECEAREVLNAEGDVQSRRMWVRFVPKSNIFSLLGKHLLGENINVNVGLQFLHGVTDAVDAQAARSKVQGLIDAPIDIPIPPSHMLESKPASQPSQGLNGKASHHGGNTNGSPEN